MANRLKQSGAARRVSCANMVGSELMRLRRSALLALHVVLAAGIGLAAGLYFASTAWDSLLAYDAFVQLLGAGAPLLAGIACGLSVDAERDAGEYAYLLGHPSRIRAFLAKGIALLGLGSLTCLCALLLFVAVLSIAGKPVPSPETIALSFAAMASSSSALYAIAIAAALAWGRNVSIGLGAIGFMVALASLGGLGNGLVTGTLSASLAPLALVAVPFTWPARLASLSIEIPLAASGTVSEAGDALDALMASAQASVAVCAIGTTVVIAAWLIWMRRFEDVRRTRE